MYKRQFHDYSRNTELDGLSSCGIYRLPQTDVVHQWLAGQTFSCKDVYKRQREGYAGIQRYPYIWAGDWGSEWQWFEPVIRAGLNIGMSGVGNWTHCMGGFEQYSPYDTELYTRWVQFLSLIHI